MSQFQWLLISLAFIARVHSQYVNDSSRIIGGVISPPDKWPFVVALLYSGSQMCGGAVWDRWHIITAAHCTCVLRTKRRMRPGPITVYIGHTNLKKKDSNYLFGIDKIIAHQYYDPENYFMNDIAILRLNRPIDFAGRNLGVRCICNPEEHENLNTSRCMVMGWGSIQPVFKKEDALTSSDLLEADMHVQSDSFCARYASFNSHFHVCAMYPGGGKDSCKGDSGGPLVCQVRGSNPPVWSLVGLTSFGSPNCGASGTPGYYTRVNRYLYWIEQNTQYDG